MNRQERRKRGIDIGQTGVQFNGRTLKVEVIINTDESLENVVSRIIPAAKGPHSRMVIVTGGVVPEDDAKGVWDVVIPIAEDQARKGGNG